eukprot:2647781-Rhodomonas_salina.1
MPSYQRTWQALMFLLEFCCALVVRHTAHRLEKLRTATIEGLQKRSRKRQEVPEQQLLSLVLAMSCQGEECHACKQ